VLVARPKPVPPAAPGPAAIPRYYVTFTLVPDKQFQGLPVTEAVIWDSATGQVNSQSLTNDNMTMEGVRLLDTDAPGDNLANSPMIVSRKSVSGTIQNALITPDGREVLMSTFRYVSSGGHRGTVIVQIAEVSAAGGPVRVLRTQTTRYTPITQYELSDTSQVLSLDPTGRYALVQGFQLGWLDLDLGRFTPLPPYSPQAPVYGVW
jgi:hypothetical protein